MNAAETDAEGSRKALTSAQHQVAPDAAMEIIQHLDLYVDFINQHGMKKKDVTGPNHMECNILGGLADPPIKTKMAVLALYHKSVSKLYTMQICSLVNKQKNVLDLGHYTTMWTAIAT